MRMLKTVTAAALLGAASVLPGAETELTGTFTASGAEERTVVAGSGWSLALRDGRLRLCGNGFDVNCFLRRLNDGKEHPFRIAAGEGRVTVESGKIAYSAPGSPVLAGARAGIASNLRLGTRAKEAPERKWKLAWADEFNTGTSPDPEKWGAEKGFIRNRELQFYTDRPENLRIEDGMLVLEARKADPPGGNPRFDPSADKWPRNVESYSYTSGSVWSRVPYTMESGNRLEVRAKFPTGAGFWPAIWATGLSRSKIGWPKCGEIDFFEYFGNQPEMFSCNLHFSGADGRHDSRTGKAGLGFDPGAEFHVYAAEWDGSEFRAYVDGRLIMSRPMPDEMRNPALSFRQPFNLRFNFALKSNNSTGILPDDALPRKFLIDYVRVYRLEE